MRPRYIEIVSPAKPWGRTAAEQAGRFAVRRAGAATVVLVASLAAGCASTPAADDPTQVKLNDLDARVARIERIISNQSLVDLAQHLDQVQADVRQLRGRIEELEYKEESMRKQQRDLYNDLDKRVAALGGGSSRVGSSGGAGSSGAGSDGSAGSGGAGGTSGGGTAGTAGAAGASGAGTPGAASGAGGTDAPGGTSEEQTVYAQSFDALKAGSYSVAITGFKDFLKSYPASPLAENAQYWLGEAYYVTHDLDSAAASFRNVMQKWPNSRKTPDAMLKLGYTQIDQKKISDGRATLTQVTQKYPGTDAARLANEKLQHTPASPK